MDVWLPTDYVSEGHAHLMNFAVDGLETGLNDSQLTYPGRKP